MDETKTRAQLEQEKEAARVAVRELENKIGAEARSAADKIRASYKVQLEKACADRAATDRALRDHICANASHKWEGKRVTRGCDFGIVEIRRQGTELPSSRTWTLPSYGAPFVRLLKKDGKPGKNIDDKLHGWTLAEPE